MDNVVINITEITDSVQVNVNEAITQVFTDGVTVTGNGTISNPLVAISGSGDMLRSTYDPTNKNADAFSMENMVEGATKKILTNAERTKLNNLSGTNTGDQDLSPYLTSATAAATYQPIGAYLTTISGLNISQLTNDSGYITSAALSPYLTSATAAATYQPIGSYLTSISGLNISQLTNDSGYITSASAAATYQPILVSGTNIKTINGASVLGSGNITISGAPVLPLGSIPFSDGSTLIENNSNLFWDNTNKRLGIGTNTPARQLDIKSSDSNAVLARMVNMSGAEFIWGISSAGYTIVSNNGVSGDIALRMTGDDNKFRFKPSGRFGIGVVNPTALLHLAAGTAAANTAPIKLTAGTNMATPENGAFEFDGTNLYFTVGGVRKTVTLV